MMSVCLLGERYLTHDETEQRNSPDLGSARLPLRKGPLSRELKDGGESTRSRGGEEHPPTESKEAQSFQGSREWGLFEDLK